MPLNTPKSRIALHIAALLLLGVLGACSDKSAESLVASGKEFTAKKEHAAAVIQLKAAVQKAPDQPELRLLLGKALLAAGDTGGAELEFARCLEARLPPSQVLPSLAKVLVLQQDYKKLVFNHGNTVLPEAAAQAEFQTHLASAWSGLGDRTKGEASIAQALAAVPDYGPALLLRARLMAGKNQFAEAVKLVDGVLARDPKDHNAWQLRGELHNVSGEMVEAEKAFNQALEIEKNFIPGHQALVALRLLKSDLAGARAQAEKLRAFAPAHPMTAYVDANVSYAAGEFPRARTQVQRLLLVAPDNVSILMLAGAVEARLGLVTQAASYFGKVVSFNPELASARESLAQAELRLGQSSKALDTLKPLLLGNSNNARALALAGDAEMRLGNAEVAERRYRQAAKLEPSNVQLQTAAIMSRASTGDPLAAMRELQALSERSKESFADEALFASHLKRGELDAALAALDVMSKKRPGVAEHLELRGRVLLAKRDFAGARLVFERAYAADPGLFGALSSLVSLDLYEKQPTKAVERLKAVIAARPQDALAMLALAEIRVSAGAPPEEVKQLLADAVKASPGSSEPRLAQISYALKKRLYKEALTFAQDALAAMPGDAQVLDAAGLAQLQAGNTEQALSTFRRLAGALGNSAGPYLRMARAYSSSGDAEKAEVSINKALELEPDSPQAQAALAELLESFGKKRNALEYVRRLKQAKPNRAYLHAIEAGLLVKAKDPEAALTTIREGLAKTQDSDLARRQYSLLVEMKRGSEADKFASNWMKQNPQDAAFEYLMSVQEISKGDYGSAQARLMRVVARYPSNTLALNNLAWVMVQNGKAKDALRYAQRAVQLAPETAALLDTLATVLAADKQIAQALEVQKRAVDMVPEDPMLRLGLGRLALQAGDKTLARAELDRLKALGPKFAGQAEVAKLLQGL